MQEWHGARDVVMKDCHLNRDGSIRPGTDLQEEPRQDGRSGGDN
jgi:hypothetical protein